MCFGIGLVRFEVGSSSDVVCSSLRSVHWASFCVICQYFIPPYFGVSAWCLVCTEHVGCNGDVQ
jgi:hypothetical protein